MNPEKTLTVRLNRKFTGYLEQNIQGKLSFVYDKNAAYPLSLNMPVRSEPYIDKDCRGFFEGLLPEGDNVRQFIGKKYGINYKNEFSLLKAIGYDCAGAVSFTDYESDPKSYRNDFIKIRGKKFTDASLEEYIKGLPLKPLLTSSDGLRLSLAGAQDKMAVVLIDDIVSLPEKNVPTTYILKSPIEGIEGSVENEYFCLKTAKAIGLNVCECEIKNTKNINYLLIKRYDREICEDSVRRIHQEDFCQAKQIISINKYEKEGGISIKDCYSIVESTKTPVINILELTNRIIFNYLIGNMDAHGKNFSLLYTDNGAELAPVYDVLCTSVYNDLTGNMAMKIGGHYEHNIIQPRHWERMAKDVGINYTMLKKMILLQANILPEKALQISKEINNPIVSGCFNVIKNNCNRIIKQFEA